MAHVITEGTRLLVRAGSSSLGLYKGRRVTVVSVAGGARPKVVIADGFGRQLVLFASSEKRLESDEFRLTDGDPSHVVTVQRAA